MRIGGVKEGLGGRLVYDVPVGNVYRCIKCGKTVVEHIWVGNNWMGHLVSYGGVVNGVSGSMHCGVSDCEVNHHNVCDGELEIVRVGRDTKYWEGRKKEIERIVGEAFANAKREA